MLRFARLKARYERLSPLMNVSPIDQPRDHSPARGSIFTMSAPMSPSNCVALGPCTNWLKSASRNPFRGPLIPDLSSEIPTTILFRHIAAPEVIPHRFPDI